MKGGYGDNYYMQLIYYIRKFKGAAQVNNKELEENKEITHSSVDIQGDFSQWDDIGTSYVDYAETPCIETQEDLEKLYMSTKRQKRYCT